MVFEVVISDDNAMLLFIFPHGLRLNMEVYIKYLEETVLHGLRGWKLEDPTSSNRTFRHATQARESRVDC